MREDTDGGLKTSAEDTKRRRQSSETRTEGGPLVPQEGNLNARRWSGLPRGGHIRTCTHLRTHTATVFTEEIKAALPVPRRGGSVCVNNGRNVR